MYKRKSSPQLGNYADEIKSVNIRLTGATHIEYFLDDYFRLISVDVSKLDASKVMNMPRMFYGWESLTSIDVSCFDTSRVMNFSGMISGCYKLTTIYTPNKTSSVMVELPWGKWKGENGKEWEYLRANAAENIMLTKGPDTKDD